MKAPAKPGWSLSDADREALARLLAAVDPGAGEDAPAFLALLTCWESAKVPWNALPTVPCYHTRDGWLTGGAPALTAIRVHVEGGKG